MRIIILIVIFILNATVSRAQHGDKGLFEAFRKGKTEEFRKWHEKKQTEFEQYRNRLNEEYAAMMERGWRTYESSPKEKRPTMPEPNAPLDADKADASSSGRGRVGEVTRLRNDISDVPVTLPEIKGGRHTVYPVKFSFYSTDCGINRFDTNVPVLDGTNNSAVAAAWRTLSNHPDMEGLVEDCLRLREELNLCDWGYVLLLQRIGETLYPTSHNEQVLMGVFLLCQSGYDARLALAGDRLVAMVCSSHVMYDTPFLEINSKRYYVLGTYNQSATIKVCDAEFRKNATPIRLVMNRMPRFSPGKGSGPVYNSSAWKAAPPFRVQTNLSVLKFMADYPTVDWYVYGLSSPSAELASSLFPAMQVLTEGLSEVDAVNLLLDFMHHGFKYMTDDEQFGYEKPFFFDENFYYPANDCEDRAILFAKLVKAVLGLDVVYIQLPMHLATAVRFSAPIEGRSVVVNGKDYYMCDPTFTNGKVGQLPAVYDTAEYHVYEIVE